MKTSLDHLPRLRQRQLHYVVRVLLEEFEKKTERGTQAWTRNGRVLKIILFGSFARGDWVDSPSTGYLSDFDILVVVNHPKLTDKAEYWEEAEDRLTRRHLIDIRFPEINFVLHDYADVNDQIARGRPFFLNLVRDGVALYEAMGFRLAKPGHMSPEIIREETIGNYEGWLPYAQDELVAATTIRQLGNWRDAAFMAHQTAERAYTCVPLTLNLYSNYTHNIRNLRKTAESLAPELRDVWPPQNGLSRRCFERIKDAYIKARYSPHYEITDEELTYGFARLEELLVLVRAVCERHIAALA
ncbi:HEPN domain-containing protein [Methylobacterium sp. J-067]|uniref:HEPN domain-containing protein n=1 Tax=Methylobacterium sp. J-067 TaxID=2836648 RepID=UPI001FB8C948|nr:HEPN domain-containing protein [Methylobacterium sp. J-067]